MIELLRESVENQSRNNEIMIEATNELKNGMTDQLTLWLQVLRMSLNACWSKRNENLSKKQLYI